MKKVLLLLVLLLSVVGASAQSWQGKEPGESDYNSSTVVYARLKTNIEKPNFVIGAFIDGACRASAKPATVGDGEQLYTIRVWGDRSADKGKTILFRACDPQNGKGLEYTLGQTLAFNDELTYGMPSAPVVFPLTIPESYAITLPDISVGQTYKLEDLLTVTPEGATLPDNLEWTATLGDQGDASEYVTIDNEAGTLTTLQAGTGITLTLTGGTAGQLAEPVTFDIVQHATGIQLLTETFRVNKGDSQTLMDFLNGGKAYTVLPEGTADIKNVQWELKDNDNTIVRKNEDGTFTPVKGGTTYMRPYIMVGETKVIPAGDKWIEIEVYVPVQSIAINTELFGQVFKANVGDTKNLYTRLAKMVTVLPEDATEKGFELKYDGDLLTQQGLTTFKAEKAGEGSIKVVATADPNVTGTISFAVEKPATKSIGGPIVYAIFKDNKETDITDVVKGNIKPDGDVYREATITVTDGTDVVTGSGTITDNVIQINKNFMAKKEGRATITIKFTWDNYDEWTGAPEACPTQEATSTFVVEVSGQLSLASFSIELDGFAVAGKDVKITFKPQPTGANDYDVEDIVVTPTTNLSQTWQDVFSWKEVSRTATEIVCEFSSQVPMVLTLEVKKNKDERDPLPLYDAKGQVKDVEIGYNLTMEKGWSWRSNPWGNLTPDQLQDVYSDDLLEIRTQRDLLYNDSIEGYFGTLMSTDGILQNQCYKLKMKEYEGETRTKDLHKTVAEAKAMMTQSATSITLEPGWNWVGYPYFFNRRISSIFGQLNAQEYEGLVVVGKNGSTEYSNGKWNPEMLLDGGQGFVIKNPSEKKLTLTYPNEYQNLQPQSETLSASANAPRSGVWQYDGSHFMNNMTMVAELDGIEHPEHFTIGAFVGDECRGEGFVDEGRAYITVHCNSGERVSFKLYNTLTGEMQNVKETLKAQTRIGSVRAPMLLHGIGLTGVDGITADENEGQAYDLTGRRTATGQRGVSIRRMADGTIRKVVKN